MGEFGNDAGKLLVRSFCGKDKARVRNLLAGGCDGLICDEGASACMRILNRDRAAGVISALKRLAIKFRAWARNANRGSAYVEVWK